MKQQITSRQWNELRDSQKLMNWIVEHKYNQNLTIGQMVEYLEEQESEGIYKLFDTQYGTSEFIDVSKWCDVLWEEVKAVS